MSNDSNKLNFIREDTFNEKMSVLNLCLKLFLSSNNNENVIDISSWASIQNIVRLGLAKKYFKVGDQLSCSHNTFKDLVWDIIGIDQDTPADGQYIHSITLQLHDLLPWQLEFDALEPSNPDTIRAKYGSNNWLESGIRQYLNSNNVAGGWWKAQTEYDAEPSYVNRAGFLYGMDEDFVSVIGEVIKITRDDSVGDNAQIITSTEKFFLPSITEVSGYSNRTIMEGQVYSYYANSSTADRIKYLNDTAIAYFLRSPSSNSSGMALNVGANGAIADYSAMFAKNKSGIAPICCIV